MDPLSATASIIAVIQITASVLSLCATYQSSVKHASKEAEQIVTELTSLKVVLEQVLLVAKREEQSNEKAASSLSKLIVSGGELDTCLQNLTNLQQKLQPRDGWKGIKDSLTWPFKTDEFRKILDRISTSKETLNLAVTVDNAMLSLSIKEDLAVISKLQSIATLNATQQDAFDWLMAPSSHDKQDRARRKYQANTGTWFVSGVQYATWKTNQKSSLWIQGIPGSGKTILTSSIIHLLQLEIRSRPNTALAFYYFDFNNTKDSHFPGLLRSLIAQLAPQNPTALALLVKEYHEHGLGRRMPSLSILSNLLVDIIGVFQDVFIVVDALDECQDRDELLDWITEVTELKLVQLHFLMASRKEKDIDEVLKPIVDFQVSINNSDIDPDIKLYIEHRLTNDRKLKKWPMEMKAEIQDSLMAKAGGMFRLAECQLDMIGKCTNAISLRKELASLPRSLQSTYSRILSEIDEAHADDALKILRWLSFSERPLILTEIVEALAIDDRTGEYNGDLKFTDPYDILTICSSLITLHPRKIRRDAWEPRDETVEELRLAHFSVKEYLTSDHIADRPDSKFHLEEGLVTAYLAEKCLSYLHRFKEYNYLNRENIREYPFATYSAKYCFKHARTADRHQCRGPHEELAVTLLCNSEMCRNWLSLHNPESHVSYESDLEHIDLRRPVNDKEIKKPLYWAALYGLFNVSSMIIAQDNDQDYGEIVGDVGTILHAAASSGNSNLIKLIVGAGADVNAIAGEDGTAVQIASRLSHEDAVRALIDLGADCSIAAGSFGSALTAAAYAGSCSIISLLIANGADLTVRSGLYGPPLSSAADRSHEAAVRLLLSHGVDINAQSEDESAALRKAAQRGSLNIVKLLVENGAEVNIQTKDGETPLVSAAENKHTDVLEYLLQHGADPNLYGSFDGTALMASAENGLIPAIQLLLDHGALTDLTFGDHPAAIVKAAGRGHWSAVELLLSRGASVKNSGVLQAAIAGKRTDILQKVIASGADIKEVSGEWSSFPLETAAAKGNLDVVKFLVEHGADVNQRGGLYSNALQASLNPESGSIAIAEFLLQAGANPDARGGACESPLSAASEYSFDNPARVNLLLRYKADVNMLHREGSALHSAARQGNLKIMAALIKVGANIEACSEDSGTPLYVACQNESSAAAKWLIEEGAIVNSRNEEYNDLSAAASRGMDDIVKLMLDKKKADVNGSLKWSGTVLSAAVDDGHISTVALLLEFGADPNVSGLLQPSAVYRAAATESLRILQVLVAAGGDIHQVNEQYGSPLYAASEAGEDGNVRYLLSLKADVNAEGGEYKCPINAAAIEGHRNVVKMLIDAGARLNIYGGDIGNVLEAACTSFENSESIVRLLLDAGMDPNIESSTGTYGRPLQAASANYQNLRVVQLLLSRGAEVNAISRSSKYGTALLAALAEGRSPEIVDLLLTNKADINIVGPRGNLLYHAASSGDESIIQRVLDFGLDINDSWGIEGSGLKMAVKSCSIKAVKLMLGKGARVELDALWAAIHEGDDIVLNLLLEAVDVNAPIPLDYGWTPGAEWNKPSEESSAKDSDLGSLEDADNNQISDERTSSNFTFALHEALSCDNINIKRLILSKTNQSTINRIVKGHGTALHVALASSPLCLCQQLLDLGADPLILGGEFKSTLQAACSSGEIKKVELILSHKPDVNLHGGKWGSAIQCAARFGHLDIVTCLLKAGADPNIRGGREFVSALQAASFYGHYKIVKMLLENGADANVYDEDLGDCLQAAASQNQFKVISLLRKHEVIGDRQSKKYGNALQASTDGGFRKTIHSLMLEWPCFRQGEMFEKAVESLRAGRFYNAAIDLERSAMLFRILSLVKS